jgi:cyanophycin synthetase
MEFVLTYDPHKDEAPYLNTFYAGLFAKYPQLLSMKNDKVQEGSYAQAFERLVFTLQTLAACTITFSKTIAKSEVYQVLVEYSEQIVGQRAYELALKLMTSVMTETTINLSEELDVIAELNEEYRLGPSTQNIVSAAIEQGIPYRRLTDGSLVQLGWGVKQQRIQAAESSKTSLIAEDIAQDKALTKALLEAVYLPVPSGRIASTLEDAWRVACELGLPVVVKPLDGNQGKGVTVNVDTQAKMELAFNAAHRISNRSRSA